MPRCQLMSRLASVVPHRRARSFTQPRFLSTSRITQHLRTRLNWDRAAHRHQNEITDILIILPSTLAHLEARSDAISPRLRVRRNVKLESAPDTPPLVVVGEEVAPVWRQRAGVGAVMRSSSTRAKHVGLARALSSRRPWCSRSTTHCPYSPRPRSQDTAAEGHDERLGIGIGV